MHLIQFDFYCTSIFAPISQQPIFSLRSVFAEPSIYLFIFNVLYWQFQSSICIWLKVH